MSTMVRIAVAALLLGLAAAPAQAESCTRSREYILTDLAGGVPQ
jgi:hypothetical protein